MEQINGNINWQDVVRDLGPRLLNYFCVGAPRALAAEAVQETLLRLYVKVQSGYFDPSKGSLKMLAYGIAGLVRLEIYRSEKISRSSEAIDDSHFVQPAQDDQKHWLRWAITMLKPVEQDVLLLLLDKDLSYEEIGTALMLPVGTVKSHAHRAKMTLKEMAQAALNKESHSE